MNAPTLFDAPGAGVRHDDPVTSVVAARSITPGKTERMILEVFLRERYPLTATEVCERLPDCYGPTVVSALARLHTRYELIAATGAEKLSPRGRPETCWKLV